MFTLCGFCCCCLICEDFVVRGCCLIVNDCRRWVGVLLMICLCLFICVYGLVSLFCLILVDLLASCGSLRIFVVVYLLGLICCFDLLV